MGFQFDSLLPDGMLSHRWRRWPQWVDGVRHLWLGINLGVGLNHRDVSDFSLGRPKIKSKRVAEIVMEFRDALMFTHSSVYINWNKVQYTVYFLPGRLQYYRCVRIDLNLWVKASLQLLGSGEISRKIGSSDFSNDLWRACHFPWG